MQSFGRDPSVITSHMCCQDELSVMVIVFAFWFRGYSPGEGMYPALLSSATNLEGKLNLKQLYSA